jgi:hypothetical protein
LPISGPDAMKTTFQDPFLTWATSKKNSKGWIYNHFLVGFDLSIFFSAGFPTVWALPRYLAGACYTSPRLMISDRDDYDNERLLYSWV